MKPILQARLPFIPWMDPRTSRLPGILPIEGEDWLRVDDAFAAQMAERDRLIATMAPLVHAVLDCAVPAAAELLDLVLDHLTRMTGYLVEDNVVTRPDGVGVIIDPSQPLLTLGRLVQEDLCLMQQDGQGEPILTGAILCFPASWTLAEKLGRPMSRIHKPVPEYDENITRRVQRLFDAIRPEQPLWRMNYGITTSAALFHPRTEANPRADTELNYVRSERQCLLRLPQTQAVVFSIHTYMARLSDLSEEERSRLIALKAEKSGGLDSGTADTA